MFGLQYVKIQLLTNYNYPPPVCSVDTVITERAHALTFIYLWCLNGQTFGKGIPDSMKHHLEQGIRRVATVCQVRLYLPLLAT